MKMLFRQRMFSWFDSYDIYGEQGETLYVVKGELAWGHQLRIYDAFGNELGCVKEKLFRFLPTFELYLGGQYYGSIRKEFSFLRPRFQIDCNGWQVEGSFFEWDYTVNDAYGRQVALVSKELFNWTDTYTIEVQDPQNALPALMLVLAIDAEKCSRND